MKHDHLYRHGNMDISFYEVSNMRTRINDITHVSYEIIENIVLG